MTNNSVGIDIDAKTSMTNIGISKQEGYIAPRYANGAVPPVLAKFESNGSFIAPKVRQFYATGAAAEIASGRDISDVSQPEQLLVREDHDRKLVFFGSNTSIGLGFGLAGLSLGSFTFGYKRQEFSFVPLGQTYEISSKKSLISASSDQSNTQDSSGTVMVDVYPSLLASTSNTVAVDKRFGKSVPAALSNIQFFATGTAAIALSQKRDLLQKLLDNDLGRIPAFTQERTQQRQEIDRLTVCFRQTRNADLPRIFSDAASKGLLRPIVSQGISYSSLSELLSQRLAQGQDPSDMQYDRYRQEYLKQISVSQGLDEAYGKRLDAHSRYVCSLV